jgi:hypothetical protein
MERATNVGVEAIMNAWQSMNSDLPYYSLWFNGKALEKYLQNNVDDMDLAGNSLEANLKAIHGTGDSLIYFLRIHPDSERAYNKNSPVVATIPCRLNAAVSLAGVGQNQGSFSVLGIREQVELEYRVKAYESELSELREMVEDLQSEPIQPADTTDTLGRVMGFIEKNPSVMGLVGQLMPLIQRFLPSLIPAVSQNNAIRDLRVPAINGVNDGGSETVHQAASDNSAMAYNERIDAALDKLEILYLNNGFGALDGDLAILAKIAETDPGKFKMLLSMLRA